jgi:hypothetical protein
VGILHFVATNGASDLFDLAHRPEGVLECETTSVALLVLSFFLFMIESYISQTGFVRNAVCRHGALLPKIFNLIKHHRLVTAWSLGTYDALCSSYFVSELAIMAKPRRFVATAIDQIVRATPPVQPAEVCVGIF